MLSIFGKRERPNYKYMIQLYRGLNFVFYWRNWFLFILCMRDSSTALGQAPRRVSLFGGVCSQTLLPMYFECQHMTYPDLLNVSMA